MNINWQTCSSLFSQSSRLQLVIFACIYFATKLI